jgi:hypothetical protein
MFVAIITISAGMIWLAYETNCFTVRLQSFCVIDIVDYESEYDGSDSEFLDDYMKQINDMMVELEAIKLEHEKFESDYQEYMLAHQPKIRRGAGGSEWEREYNRDRTCEMRTNKMTTETAYYRGVI